MGNGPGVRLVKLSTMITSDERISRLEGVYEQVDKRLDSIDRRLNTLLILMCGSWVTIIVAITGLYVKG